MKFIKLMAATETVDYFIIPADQIQEIHDAKNQNSRYWQSMVYLKDGQARPTRSSIESIWVMLQ